MARTWKAGGQELWDDQIPFAPGTDEYYRYVSEWRAKALGVSYEGVGGVGKDEGYDKGAYEKGIKDWRKQQYEATRALDRSGQQATGYAGAPGAAFRDLNGNGVRDGAEQVGKYQNAATAYDNSWNDVDGQDVRTDEQKFYNRDTSNFEQVADAYGTYNWYADWSYRDGQGATQKKKVNLTTLGDRDGRDAAGKDTTGAGLDYARDAETATYGGHNYHQYNGAPDKKWFDDQIRNRKNMSVYARTV